MFLFLMWLLPLAGYSLLIVNAPMIVLMVFLVFLLAQIFVFILTGKYIRPQSTLMPGKFTGSFLQSPIGIIVVQSLLAFIMFALLGVTINGLSLFNFNIEVLLLLGAIFMSELLTYFGSRLMYTDPYSIDSAMWH